MIQKTGIILEYLYFRPNKDQKKVLRICNKLIVANRLNRPDKKVEDFTKLLTLISLHFLVVLNYYLLKMRSSIRLVVLKAVRMKRRLWKSWG